MNDHLLNFVRCEWCGGNAGSPSHRCPPEAAERREQAAQEAVAKMFADLHAPAETATADQLRRKLIECEAALDAMTENYREACDLLSEVAGGGVDPVEVDDSRIPYSDGAARQGDVGRSVGLPKQTRRNSMKRIIETTEATGLEALLGERIQLWCMNYIYAGTLVGVNETCVELAEAEVVYETGPLGGKPTNAQRLPGDVWYVAMGAIESFGVQPQ